MRPYSARLAALLLLLLALVWRLPDRVYAGIEDTGVDTANGETLQTNPKTRSVQVSAKVVDTIPPTVPILIAPPDGTTLTTTLPTFIWKPSTDEQGIGKYQLWLDGNLLFDNIPTGSTTNSQYTLIVEDGEMKLTPKTSLAQGLHPWKIVAYDIYDNQATSAIWNFTVDTLAPTTIVTKIGKVDVHIASDNPGSVPTEAVKLSDNEPSIFGTSENGAALRLTLSVPGEADQVFNLTVTNGTFNFPLGVLPVDTVMHFTITSSDAVGNTSIINQVPFIISSAVIIITPPLPEATPVIIPIPRPEEIIKQPPEAVRPPVIRKLLEEVPILTPLVENPIIKTLSEIIPPLTVAAPLLVTTAVAVQTGASILGPLLELLSRLLQALGLLPVKKPRGVVYDTKSGKPIAFATINIIRTADFMTLESVVSDVEGIYRSIKLPTGTYKLEALHPEYTFPTRMQPHFLVNPHDFYRGEEFTIQKESEEELFMIPMDPVAAVAEDKKHFYSHLALASLRRLVFRLFYPLALFSFILTLFYPTIWNIAVCIIYVAMIGFRLYRAFKQPHLVGFVHETGNKPVANTMVRISQQKTNHLVALLVTNSDGYFRVSMPPGDYAITFTKDGYMLPPELGEFNTVYLQHQAKNQQLDINFLPFEVLQAIQNSGK